MNTYTVVFEHPDKHTSEYVYIRAMDTRSAHLMFFGKLANVWGYGWDNTRFAEGIDLSQTRGTLMISDNVLSYTILPGHQKLENDTSH